jgi:uncharacterized membrane protein YvbJ
MIRCEACGTENPPDAAYCSNCARKLDPATQEAVARRRAEHRATGIRWSAVLTTAIAIIIILLIVLFATHVI